MRYTYSCCHRIQFRFLQQVSTRPLFQACSSALSLPLYVTIILTSLEMNDVISSDPVAYYVHLEESDPPMKSFIFL